MLIDASRLLSTPKDLWVYPPPKHFQGERTATIADKRSRENVVRFGMDKEIKREGKKS